MTRGELVLKKLHELSDEEIENAIKSLTKFVSARLKFNSYFDKTRTGAHSEGVLGVEPINYYVGESIRKLYDPNSWDWQFEKYTLSQQLTRIANKLISDQVAKYKRDKEKITFSTFKDASEYFDLADESNDEDWHENTCNEIIELAFELSQDDDKLFYFTTMFFDGFKSKDIAKELNIAVEKVYVLHKKLLRRIIKHKDKLANDHE